MKEEKGFLSHKSRRMKHKKRAPNNEAPSFNLADFIADKLLLSSAYVLFKPAADYNKFYGESHQLFLTTLPNFQILKFLIFKV